MSAVAAYDAPCCFRCNQSLNEPEQTTRIIPACPGLPEMQGHKQCVENAVSKIQHTLFEPCTFCEIGIKGAKAQTATYKDLLGRVVAVGHKQCVDQVKAEQSKLDATASQEAISQRDVDATASREAEAKSWTETILTILAILGAFILIILCI